MPQLFPGLQAQENVEPPPDLRVRNVGYLQMPPMSVQSQAKVPRQNPSCVKALLQATIASSDFRHLLTQYIQRLFSAQMDWEVA